MGTPVFDEEGHFIGIHIARYSRAMGLIIPAEQLRDQAMRLLDPAPETAQEKTPTELAPAGD